MTSANSDIEDWDRVAHQYSEMSMGVDSRFYKVIRPHLMGSLLNSNYRTIMDLGCGDGWLANELSLNGSDVTAIDGSKMLLEKGKIDYADIKFIQHDLSLGLPKLNDRFDAVVSFMVLMDIPDIQPLFKDVYDILEDDGKFIFTILHPCYFNFKCVFDEQTQQGYRKVDRYLKPEVWRLDSFGGHNHYHRSITFYSNCLAEAGFSISKLIEPEHIPATHDCDFYRDIPILLFVEATKVNK